MDISIGKTTLNINKDGYNSKQKNDALYNACQKFEAVFTSYLLKSMRKTVPDTGTKSGIQKDIYTSMMDDEIAKSVSMGPGIGLADVLYRQLSQIENYSRVSRKKS
ncbi:flagellar biosynthesis protein FlgJ [Candidatus Poribacteria bacterium]|nr:flagellar biosynthesis protein FlgJ [Candidatus Poribacteria bacterium]